MTPAKLRSRKPAGKALASLSHDPGRRLRTTPQRLSHSYAIFVSRAKQLGFGGFHTQSSFPLCSAITAQPGVSAHATASATDSGLGAAAGSGSSNLRPLPGHRLIRLLNKFKHGSWAKFTRLTAPGISHILSRGSMKNAAKACQSRQDRATIFADAS